MGFGGFRKRKEKGMKLNKTSICIDCDNVFERKRLDSSNSCPDCGSESTMPLSTWVRPLGTIRAVVIGTTYQEGGVHVG